MSLKKLIVLFKVKYQIRIPQNDERGWINGCKGDWCTVSGSDLAHAIHVIITGH